MYVRHGSSLLVPDGAPPSLRLPHKPTLTFIDSATSTSDASSYNFGNFTPARPGLLVVGVMGVAGAGTVACDSVSIGGTNGIIHVTNTTTRAANAVASRKVGAVATNVTVGFDATMARAAVSVWLLTGYASAVPDDTDETATVSDVTSRSVTLQMRPGGVAVFAAGAGNDVAALNMTWSDATTVYQTDVETNTRFEAADYSVVAPVSHTETASWAATNTTTFAALVGACWH